MPFFAAISFTADRVPGNPDGPWGWARSSAMPSWRAAQLSVGPGHGDQRLTTGSALFCFLAFCLSARHHARDRVQCDASDGVSEHHHQTMILMNIVPHRGTHMTVVVGPFSSLAAGALAGRIGPRSWRRAEYSLTLASFAWHLGEIAGLNHVISDAAGCPARSYRRPSRKTCAQIPRRSLPHFRNAAA